MVKKVVGSYAITRTIGSGGFSKVFTATHLTTGEEVSIKRISKENNDKEKVMREIRLMKELDHPFAVQFYELIEDDEYYYLVMEYVKGITLLNLVNNSSKIEDWKIRHIFVELVSCIGYLHNEVKIAHRDIKLENIIVDSEGNIRLIDFGLGNDFDVSDGILKTACGSPTYAPPEMFLNTPYTNAADMWSLGCVLYAMATKRLPFEDSNAKKLAAKIVYQQPVFPADMNPSLVTLLKSLMNKNPALRPEAYEIFKFEWVNSYPNRDLFSDEFGLDQKWRYKRGEFELDQFVLADIRRLNLYSDQICKDMIEGKFTSDSAIYRILKRNKTTLEMASLFNFVQRVADSVSNLGRAGQTLSFTSASLTSGRRSHNARNKYMFANVCSPISGISRLSATVKLSNRLNGAKMRIPPKPIHHATIV